MAVAPGQQQHFYSMYDRYVNDCFLEAEFHEYFSRLYHDAGYAGCTFRRYDKSVEISVRVAEPDMVNGKNHEKIHQVESLVAQRLNIKLENVTILVEKILARGLSADILANIVQKKIEDQVPVRQAAMFVIRSALRAGAGGCEVRIAGKLRQQRANAQKYQQGVIISAGKPGKDFVDRAVRHIPLKQGIFGVQVKVYNPRPKDSFGRVMVLPDHVEVNEARPVKSTERRQGGRDGDKEQGGQHRQRQRREGDERPRRNAEGQNQEGAPEKRHRRPQGEGEHHGERPERGEGRRNRDGGEKRQRQRHKDNQDGAQQ